MKPVAKYNIFKGVSTFLTVGTPIITLSCMGDLFVHRADTAISACGVFAILLSLLFAKDKILEQFKSPSAFKVALVGLVLIYIAENIIFPLKCVFWATLATTAVDEVSFKRLYKKVEKAFPNLEDYKHIGFIFTTSKNLLKEQSDEDE